MIFNIVGILFLVSLLMFCLYKVLDLGFTPKFTIEGVVGKINHYESFITDEYCTSTYMAVPIHVPEQWEYEIITDVGTDVMKFLTNPNAQSGHKVIVNYTLSRFSKTFSILSVDFV